MKRILSSIVVAILLTLPVSAFCVELNNFVELRNSHELNNKFELSNAESVGISQVVIDLLKATNTNSTGRTVWGLPSDGVIADGESLLDIDPLYPAITGGRWLAPGWSDVSAIGESLVNSLSVANAGTNVLFNSDSPATQTTLTQATGNWTLNVFGAGSAIASAGTATISGEAAATEDNPDTFSVDAGGTITVTVTGALDYFQLESGDIATPIIITAGAEGTRDADINTVPTPVVLTGPQGAVEMVVDPADTGQASVYLFSMRPDANNYTSVYATSTAIFIIKRVGGVLLVNKAFTYTHTAGTPLRFQAYWDDVLGAGIRAADASADITAETFATDVNTDDAFIDTVIHVGARDSGTIGFIGEYANNGLPICYSSKEAAGW